MKYSKDDLGIIEGTMYRRHDHGYCVRPKPCLCDEGREALARVEARIKELEAAGFIPIPFAQAIREWGSLKGEVVPSLRSRIKELEARLSRYEEALREIVNVTAPEHDISTHYGPRTTCETCIARQALEGDDLEGDA